MRALLVAAALLAAGIQSAAATDVGFTGTLTGVCALAVATNGTLAIDAAGRLSSAAGVFGTATLISVGTNQINVAAPVWQSGGTPVGYDSTGEVLEVAYAGLGGLNAINVDYTNQATHFSASTLPITTIRVNARASNTNGFAPGAYAMKVVVTCS